MAIYIGGQQKVPVTDLGWAGGPIVWDDLLVDISLAKVPAANAPSWDDITLAGFTFKALAFEVDEYVDIFIQTRHAVQLSTIISNHIHWTIDSDDNGNEFQFSIQGVASAIGGSFSAVAEIKSGNITLNANAGKHNYLDIGDIPATFNTTVSTIFVLRLKRIAVTAGAGIAETARKIFIFFNDSHVKIDVLGSLQETSKT